MTPCSHHSLHDTIPLGKDTCMLARSSDLSLVWSNNSRPDRRPRLNYSTRKARQKPCTMCPCPYHYLHDTIPSGKDTCRPARSSDLSMVRSNNSHTDRGPCRCCSTQNTGQKFLLCPQREIMLFIGKPKGRSRMISNDYSLHDTISSGKDMGTPALSSDLSVGRRNNGHSGTRPWPCSTSGMEVSKHKN